MEKNVTFEQFTLTLKLKVLVYKATHVFNNVHFHQSVHINPKKDVSLITLLSNKLNKDFVVAYLKESIIKKLIKNYLNAWCFFQGLFTERKFTFMIFSSFLFSLLRRRLRKNET